MKKIIVFAAIILLAGSAGIIEAQTIVGSKHDLSAELPVSQRVCVFCHTPHQVSAASYQYPLWNHNLSMTDFYGVYGSPTLDAFPEDLGFAMAGSATISNLCLSCHDGTVGLGSLYNDPNVDGGEEWPLNEWEFLMGNANVGTNLSNDHPVNFTYNTALAVADGELYDPAVTPSVAALLSDGKVQCSSCHDPHNPTYGAFLRLSNASSALCTTCHIK